MILDGIQQVELVNQSMDWYNFLLNAGVTGLSVFIGAGLAHLSAWYINKRQFEKNMTIEKDNQDRLSNLEYWEEVYKVLLKTSEGLKQYRMKCIDRVNNLHEGTVRYEVMNNIINADSLLFMDTQKELEYLMFRIEGNEKFEDVYKLYLKYQVIILADSEAFYNCLITLNKAVHNYGGVNIETAIKKYGEVVKSIDKTRQVQEELLKKIIENIKKYS